MLLNIWEHGWILPWEPECPVLLAFFFQAASETFNVKLSFVFCAVNHGLELYCDISFFPAGTYFKPASVDSMYFQFTHFHHRHPWWEWQIFEITRINSDKFVDTFVQSKGSCREVRQRSSTDLNCLFRVVPDLCPTSFWSVLRSGEGPYLSMLAFFYGQQLSLSYFQVRSFCITYVLAVSIIS